MRYAYLAASIAIELLTNRETKSLSSVELEQGQTKRKRRECTVVEKAAYIK
jgi:hypothetical protein